MFWSYWKLAVAAQETAIASWVTINQRMWRFASGDMSSGNEALRMVAEKQSAFLEANYVWQQQMARMAMSNPPPEAIARMMTKATHEALKPYRAKSRANARRLSRSDK